jgi:uroporphyrin-III C-methyltransferase
MQKNISPVYLVGAGAGAPDLISLKAARAIAQASVLLVDDLVNEAIVQEHASPAANIIHVGKRGGQPSTPQAQIQRLLVEHALAGERVVRLKGGDPLIFGRAGEEIAALQSAGIPFVIVNGISAAQAAAADLGISLTHREHARGMIWVTGHASPQNQEPKWEAIGHAALTTQMSIAIYMGMTRAHTVQTELLKALPAHTPVAIVQNASLPTQRHAIATLGTLAQTIERAQLASPSIIIIGHVLDGLAALRDTPATSAEAGMTNTR